MWNRRTFLAALGVGSLGFAGQAVAGPSDIPPREYGASINRSLDQAGFDLRLMPGGCRGGPVEQCSFSSLTVTVVVDGQASPGRIARITISTDLLRDDPDVPPGDLIADAGAVLAVTMASFDPGLPAKRREQLLSNLTKTALTQGHSEGNGIRVRYTLEFDQGADGLLVIIVTPK
jgi:hypothetical protein